jgi:3-dehydroquinate synthase
VNTIEVDLGQRSYPIHVGSGLLADEHLLDDAVAAEQVMVVSTEVVAPLYLDTVRAGLPGRRIETVILPDGEQYKTLGNFATIIDALIDARFHRDACIVALGGGVVGDIAGFAAATYQRGIDFVQIPTTILAQVDSSVGGKTAVNHPKAKNMIGAFYQPAAVITDLDTLKTLPPRELIAGFAEVIKYGLIEDADFFGWLEQSIDGLRALDPAALTSAIVRSCEIKAAIVAEDERERGRRALLNLGHTFGHGLEALGDYGRWLHGEAVAIGIQMAVNVSAALGWIDSDDAARVEALLRRAGLPVEADGIDPEALLDRMALDKKATREGIRLILLKALGHAVVEPAPDREVVRAAIGKQVPG